MGFRKWMTLLLTLALVIGSPPSTSAVLDGGAANKGNAASLPHDDSLRSHGIAAAAAAKCNALTADCMDKKGRGPITGGHPGPAKRSQRKLAQTHKLTSIKAFKRDHIPCHHRGKSYYDCPLGSFSI